MQTNEHIHGHDTSYRWYCGFLALLPLMMALYIPAMLVWALIDKARGGTRNGL